MTLSGRVASAFGPRDRARGREYFFEGRVQLLRTNGLGAIASVRGSRPYVVRIDASILREDGLLLAGCECPRFDDGLWCKHVWATVLALDARSVDFGARGGPVDLEPNDPELDAVAGMEDADDFLQAPPRGWKEKLSDLERFLARRAESRRATPAGEREILYEIDLAASKMVGELEVCLFARRRKKNGEWARPRPARLGRKELAAVANPSEAELLELLYAEGVKSALLNGESPWGELKVGSVTIPSSLDELLVPRLAATGRLFWSLGEPRSPLVWDGGPPYRVELRVVREEGGENVGLAGALRREDEERSVLDVVLPLPPNLVFFEDRIATLESGDDLVWASFLHELSPITVPSRDVKTLVERLYGLSPRPPVALPPELAIEERRVRPTPSLRLARPDGNGGRLEAELQFDYEGTLLDAADRTPGILEGRRFTARDADFEATCRDRLLAIGIVPALDGTSSWSLDPSRLPESVEHLTREGFVVLAEGRRVRTPSASRLSLASGIDWLDLEGEIDFDGEVAAVPEILASLRRGDRFVRLGDGTEGLLPEAWLERAGVLDALSPERREKALRFRPHHALLLDALLESEASFEPDAGFVRLRERLRSFRGIKAVAAPRGFRGELRGYQKEGLAWLHFLAEYGFGGCLADDMGLGKTIQVLAFLQATHRRRAATKPSLVVVPRSLVHNWIEEAARFVPKLRVAEYASPGRTTAVFEDGAADVVVTTYGVLRRDVAKLRDKELATVVLDEAQAIKNERSQAAKASRLLRAERRLALSGTPVENHLGELWSLFEFLNPGMLGRLARSRRAESEAALLSRAVRPFILRRTKEQVLHELPPKNEQTILCPLEGRQRKLYEEIRRHYQHSLRARVRESGLGRSKMWVLEALLRLRQAACHPELLDRSGKGDGSAKLDALLPRLEEVVAEGHKALVFSQFTKFLAIVRGLLDERGLAYEYLDGRTRDRKRKVERFQTDPECPVFLVSLKAGGVGLNLTAADYVFLLDPWWNPAVEAQAVDRAHRIGQRRTVFAYRLIAENTVEEKILALQRRKRELADAILVQDGALLRSLTAEDLELLLS